MTKLNHRTRTAPEIPATFSARSIVSFLGAQGCRTATFSSFQEICDTAADVFQVGRECNYVVLAHAIDKLGKSERKRRLAVWLATNQVTASLRWPAQMPARRISGKKPAQQNEHRSLHAHPASRPQAGNS